MKHSVLHLKRLDKMKYLFVIYTDIEYRQHLDHFKTQGFYQQICDDTNIEVIEWGTDFHTDYRNLPTKTQEMMKWCSENKEYDYLIKCDDTIFNDTWSHYREKLTHENIFVNGRDGFSYNCDRWGDKKWTKVCEDTKDDYWGLNYLFNSEEVWKIYFDGHYDKNEIDYNLKFIKNDIQFYEGKFYVVSKSLSIFIGRQENFAKRMNENFPVEDLMVGYLAESF